MVSIIIAVIVIALVFWIISLYNKLVDLRNQYRNAFAQIDVQLKRRYDLIPNLVKTARSYMGHERDTLEAVTTARNAAQEASTEAAADPSNASSLRKLAQADAALGSSLARLFAVGEAYPDLKASQIMGQLSSELSATENQIAAIRETFNDAVTVYNTTLGQFPANAIASAFKFSPAELLKATESEAERKAVAVQF